MLTTRSFAPVLCGFCFIGAGNVLEELLDQVDVGEDHAAAAVAGETELVEGIPVRRLC